MIQRVSHCTAEEFHSTYLEPRRPVIITALADRWPALTGWAPDELARRFGQRRVEVRRGDKQYYTTLSSYVEYLKKQAKPTWGRPAFKQDPATLLYLHALVLAETLPELLEDFEVPSLFATNWLERPEWRSLLPIGVRQSSVLFIGPPDARSRTHRDRYHTHAWFTQLHGEKKFKMLAPNLLPTNCQDPDDTDRALVIDLARIDHTQYSELDPSWVHDVSLRPGDTLFIPAGWWHSASCLTTSVSLSGNFVNQSNFQEFAQDLKLPENTFAGAQSGS